MKTNQEIADLIRRMDDGIKLEHGFRGPDPEVEEAIETLLV